MGRDMALTKKVIEETNGVVANSRKREILNLFSEV
jgi:hypothetical protein